jgi:hypothetical protein
MTVNPVMRGLDAIYSKPVANKIKELATNNDEKWIAIGTAEYSQFLIACGASTISSINFYPNMDLWRALDPSGEYALVYNRYAHINVSLINEPTWFELDRLDVFSLHLSYDDLSIANVKYVYSPRPLEDIHNLEKIKFNLLYEYLGAWIYSVEIVN